MARPSKYKKLKISDHLDTIQDYCKRGATYKELARIIGVSVSTIFNWLRKYPEFKEACQVGVDFANTKVENALFKSAIGYTVTETKTVETDQGVTVTTREKHIPPSNTAQIFWLKSKKPNTWLEKEGGSQDLSEAVEILRNKYVKARNE